MGKIDTERMHEQVIDVLRLCFDPEIPVNIYDLGLIYDVDVAEEGLVRVQMTLTSPSCPVAEILPGQVERSLKRIKGVEKVEVEVVWDPPWDARMMTEEARLELGMM
jgi:FeS assembly SUF system protein